eukprot:CAMPEP_0117031138 /NCGR_PEP_ID=MMETSP0472-20121206/22418_1 /TAXON_ID=693140 ORGANISM="Tiarina fusus, Strain LIS" /NCGR_SAMPLE_ID=MMETSP0472 /ASSEMBLY_ACC=CAM_ASM_000603 /LENGTH=157 /DNA_ID=CAMNT_0004739407 /DNA_START=70 /DNA_END=543 /DNA_ORIENTATION=+
MNNHWNTSPIVQTNETARKGTPKSDEDEDGSGEAPKQAYMLAEDLQKIRRSNHSSHQRRREMMDDDEHDDIIKGLLYPGLEESSEHDDFDFFEEDYEMAQAAVGSAASDSLYATASNNNNDIYNSTPRIDEEMSYFESYYASMGRPYSDLTNEKLGR